MFYDETAKRLQPLYADAVVFATGGQNRLFGKTTGSALCDGYAAGQLFLQGAKLKNLEFIQYHPTTIETPQKRMLITEGARGDGGRLYYMENGKRVYFMEEKYGEKGNLMPRDIVSQMHLRRTKPSVFGHCVFRRTENQGKPAGGLRPVPGIPRAGRYKGKHPVAPSVHFFMGGLAVDAKHRTNIRNLYAVGECASMYHGANRLGGNSLLAAVYSGRVAARDIAQVSPTPSHANFESYIREQNEKLSERAGCEKPVFRRIHTKRSRQDHE